MRELEEKRDGGKLTCAAEGELPSIPGSEGGPGASGVAAVGL